jgi:2,4-dienoyl-CoA reductase (NADPH2)
VSTVPERAAQPFSIGHVTLRNRIVGAPHGRGILDDGLALPEDAEYWRRLAAGGAAMVTAGGTVTAPESTWRRRIVTEAWREEGIPGLASRARAIRSEGAVAACQLVPSRVPGLVGGRSRRSSASPGRGSGERVARRGGVR